MRADLALIGFGNVGRRFARLLAEQRGNLLQRYDLDCRVVAIATRSRGIAYDPHGLAPLAAADLIEGGRSLTELLDAHGGDPPQTPVECIHRLGTSPAPIRVVVETTTLSISDGRPAIDHVEAALAAACHVVTANKGPAAFAYRRLMSLAEIAGVSFLFEGAVLDGIPVFNLVRETLPAVTVNGFRGVVNATTNEILTALEQGEPLAPTLARMQAEGIAEADPSLDLDGWDAAAKAAALANVLLDTDVTPHDVDREGVSERTADAAHDARVRGNRLRLVASATRGRRPSVKLEELAADDLLAGLRGSANALVLDTDLLGRLAISQLGGGLVQTAYALLGDLITVRRRQSAHPAAPVRRIP
jgi:homoserine dehydrogenase